jgi:L-ascorbate metabolism protein UlaG (beta-lactamase superfamily)
MKLEYLGHACFRIEFSNGAVLVTDPYKPGSFGNALRYAPVGTPADIVTVSHSHDDHWDPSAGKGSPKVFRKAGSFEHKGVKVLGVDTYHDSSGGKERGANVVFVFEAEGLRVAHLGDLGHLPSADQVKKLGAIDVALVPVGGHFTIDAAEAVKVVGLLGAKVAVPMHFKTSKCDFPIAAPDAFLAAAKGGKRIGSFSVELKKETLPKSPETWLLDPAR